MRWKDLLGTHTAGRFPRVPTFGDSVAVVGGIHSRNVVLM